MSLRRLLGGSRRGPAGPGGTPPRGMRATSYRSREERVAHLVRATRGADRRWVAAAQELVGVGDAVWEIGAASGEFAFAAAILAGSAGTVLVVTVDPDRAERLRQAADRLEGPDARFDVLEAGPGGGRADPTALDELLDRQRAPTLVKLDLAGAAARPFEGAARLLSEVRPILLVEVAEPARDAVGAALQRHRYQLFDAFTNPSDRLRLDRPVATTLAIPGRPASS